MFDVCIVGLCYIFRFHTKGHVNSVIFIHSIKVVRSTFTIIYSVSVIYSFSVNLLFIYWYVARLVSVRVQW